MPSRLSDTPPQRLSTSPLRAPVNVTWEITEACNLDCAHCLSAELRAEQRGETTGMADLGSPFGLMLRAFGFTVLWTVSYYVMLTYLPTFSQRHAGLSPAEALWAGAAGQVVLVPSHA